MKHTTAVPRSEAREACGDCNSLLPASLLRLVATDPPRFRCTNQAACRKRQRQRATKTEPRGKTT